MTNMRLKKTESKNRQKDSPEEIPHHSKEDAFIDNSSEDELTKKRKMVLTGITAGVGVAGATAAGLLFFGPYSPFGVKSSEKTDNLVTEQKAPVPSVEEKSKVQVPPPVIAEQTQTVVAAAPHANKEEVVQKTPHVAEKKEVQKAPNPVIAIAPVVPPEKPAAKKSKLPVQEVQEASGPAFYNYDIQDGGPVIEVPSKKKITISRDPDFRKIYLHGNLNHSDFYRITIPPPGDIYWKEEGKPAHKMTINPPTSSGIRFDAPAKMKMNENLSWSATGKVSFYRVEVASDVEFLNRVKVFSTNKTTLPVEFIGQGKWFVRLSSLNLQSGTWDSTKVFPVDIAEVSHKETALPSEKIEETAKEKVEEPSKETSETITTDASVTKPVEPVNPVEATVPEKQPASKKTEE